PSEFERTASCNRSPPQVGCRPAPTDSPLDSPPARSRRGDLDAHESQGAPPFIKETRMRLTTMCSATVIAFTVGVGQAGAQTRYDVGLLLGATRTSDEGAALAFDRATTYQATFAWRTWEGSKVVVSLEVPFLASPAFTVAKPGGSLPKEYAALYLTP